MSTGYTDSVMKRLRSLTPGHTAFCLGNTVKYIARAGKKDSALQDLKKAQWYLDHEIEIREATNAKG